MRAERTQTEEMELRAEVSRQLLWIAAPSLALACLLAIRFGHPLLGLCFTALLGVDLVDHMLCQARLGRAASVPISPIAAVTIVFIGSAAFAAL